MAQPTGPQFADGAAYPPSPPPLRAAAGRDMRFATFLPLHFGQRTSSSSDFRRMSSSKGFAQSRHSYS